MSTLFPPFERMKWLNQISTQTTNQGRVDSFWFIPDSPKGTRRSDEVIANRKRRHGFAFRIDSYDVMLAGRLVSPNVVHLPQVGQVLCHTRPRRFFMIFLYFDLAVLYSDVLWHFSKIKKINMLIEQIHRRAGFYFQGMECLSDPTTLRPKTSVTFFPRLNMWRHLECRAVISINP